MTVQEQIDSIIGPQVSTGDWYDFTLVTKAKLHGEACPAEPPTDPAAWDQFANLHYYDLARSEYVAYRRTNDATYQTLARKCADSWYAGPWIQEGTVRDFDNGKGPSPRSAGIVGLICRSLDGRPEMFEWVTVYTRHQFDVWLKRRINDPQLYYGLRDGAFMLRYAVALAKAHPDPAVRAEMLANIEAIIPNYFGRLQQADGSWRWNDLDASGGPFIGIMQPFMVGLYLGSAIDAYDIVSETVRASIKNQILKACRHLYGDGPYIKDQVEQKSGRKVRGFHYFYHGGTQSEPAKYEKGDIVFPWTADEDWYLPSTRQAISMIAGPMAFAYMISGEQFYKDAAQELYDSAYLGTDGVRGMMADTPKNFNQNVSASSFKAWSGAAATPQPIPLPTEPVKTPSPDGTKGATIIDSQLAVWTIGAQKQTLRNGTQAGGGQGTLYKYASQTVYVLGMDSNWYKWSGSWSSVGPTEPGMAQPTPQPEPQPIPIPQPVPEPPKPAPRVLRWPTSVNDQMVLIQNQAGESYRPTGRLLPRPANQPKGTYVEFVKW